MQTKLHRGMSRLLCGGAISVLAVAAYPAFAQAADAAPAGEATQVDEVVVTGVTKQAANVQDVPTAITAFSGDDLVDRGVKEVREIATVTPGFSFREGASNPTTINLAMRGQVQNDVLATLEPSVGVYLDDMYVARAYGLNTNLLDVKGVEVLKGPQGTLFGRNTSAGALLLSTNDPRFNDTSASLQVGYGNLDDRTGTAILNLSASDNFAVRGAFYAERREGYQTDVHTNRTYAGRTVRDGRLKLAYRPGEHVEILLSGEWYDLKMAGPVRQNLYFNLGGAGANPAAADQALFGGDPDKVAATPSALVAGAPARGPYNDMTTETYIAKLIVDVPFGQVKWVNGYRRIDGANFLDLDGASGVAGNHYTLGFQNLTEWTSELQLTGQAMDGKLSFATGLTYLKEDGADTSRSSTNGSASWSGFTGDLDNSSYGVYGQVNYKATDALSFTVGVRYSNDRKGVTTQSAVFPSNGTTIAACLPNPAQLVGGVPIISPADYAVLVANGCHRSREDTFTNVSYTLGLDYKINDDMMVYAKQSRGYRSGAEQLRSLTLTDTTPAAPEVVNEQEIGFKSEFFDRRLRFNVAGYHNNVKGAQRSVILSVNGINQTILENADIETWGGEAEINYKVAPGFSIFATGALTSPKYTSYNGFVVAGGVLTPSDKKDTNFVGIVEKQFTVGANFSRDIGFGRFDFNVSYSWQDKMYQTEQTVARLTAPAATGGGGITTVASAQALLAAGTTPAYGILNARTAVSFGENDQYEVSLWGRNILDERQPTSGLFVGGLNYVSVVYNEPATYGVTARIKF